MSFYGFSSPQLLLCCFDVNQEKLFRELQQWLNKTVEIHIQNHVLGIVATKIDVKQRANLLKLRKFARESKFLYFLKYLHKQEQMHHIKILTVAAT